VTYQKDQLVMPRKIVTPDDVRPGTKKGKLDTTPIWIVEITMPINLMKNIYDGMQNQTAYQDDPTKNTTVPDLQPIDQVQPVTAQT
jgi:hypothetical protein